MGGRQSAAYDESSIASSKLMHESDVADFKAAAVVIR